MARAATETVQAIRKAIALVMARIHALALSRARSEIAEWLAHRLPEGISCWLADRMPERIIWWLVERIKPKVEYEE